MRSDQTHFLLSYTLQRKTPEAGICYRSPLQCEPLLFSLKTNFFLTVSDLNAAAILTDERKVLIRRTRAFALWGSWGTLTFCLVPDPAPPARRLPAPPGLARGERPPSVHCAPGDSGAAITLALLSLALSSAAGDPGTTGDSCTEVVPGAVPRARGTSPREPRISSGF